MEFPAKLRHLRISPRKVRLVIDQVRGLDVVSARNQLHFINKRSARPVLKLLESAIANAKNNYPKLNLKVEEENLFIKTITADQGPTLKRWKPRAFGRATPILKRSTHINLVLAEKKASKVKKAKQQPKPDLKPVKMTKEEAKEQEETKVLKPEPVKDETKPKGRFSNLTKLIRRTGAK